MFRSLAVGAIVGYQRYISPRKGFCCAYRHLTGGHSCSTYGLKIVQRLGVLALWKAMPRQFARCRLAYAALKSKQEEQPQKEKKEKHWSEYCDCLDPFEVCDCFPLPRIRTFSACDLDAPCDINPCDANPCDCSP